MTHAPPEQDAQLKTIGARRYAWTALVVAAVMIATRWPLRSRYLFAWDSANFAQALDNYNVAFHHPQPPGYPLYVAAAWVLRRLVRDANTAYVVLGLAASIVAALVLLGLAWRLYGYRLALLATSLFVASPNTWGHGEVAYPYAFLALGAGSVAWCAVEARVGRRSLTLWGAVALALGGGFRPDLVVFLLPTWLFGSARSGLTRLLCGGLVVIAVVLAWLVPTVQLSGGWGTYRDALTAYSDVWAPPIDAGPAGFLGAVGQNVAELARFGVPSLGPLWGILLVFAVGRLLAPASIARDWRKQLLLVWVVPPLVFYTLVHVGNLGYLLSVLPAAAILGALAADALASDLVRLTRVTAHGGAWSASLSGALIVLSCALEGALFLFSRGPVSLAEIRHVDASLSAKVPYVASLPPETTYVLAYDRFAQFAYYLPGLRASRHLRSLNNILGPDTNADNRQTLVIPPGVRQVVLVDLDLDAADRPLGLQRKDLAPGIWVYQGQVRRGDELRVGYAYARVLTASQGALAIATPRAAPCTVRPLISWQVPPMFAPPILRRLGR